jgi:hypothetical protein
MRAAWEERNNLKVACLLLDAEFHTVAILDTKNNLLQVISFSPVAASAIKILVAINE